MLSWTMLPGEQEKSGTSAVMGVLGDRLILRQPPALLVGEAGLMQELLIGGVVAGHGAFQRGGSGEFSDNFNQLTAQSGSLGVRCKDRDGVH